MRLENIQLELAKPADAEAIAILSRDTIETGLPWRWRPLRVSRLIGKPEAIVLAARTPSRLIGFAIMLFAMEDAHLLLLAVAPGYRQQGLGTALCAWLEKSARVAGVLRLHLAVRAGKLGARVFYRSLAYTEAQTVPDYYPDREAAILMTKRLTGCQSRS